MTREYKLQQIGNRVSGLVGTLHHSLVYGRRVTVLAQQLALLLPPGCRLLDIGCGDGALGALVSRIVPGVQILGVEAHARSSCAIPFQLFDGEHLPFGNDSFDGCLFVDVIHHVRTPLALLGEARRVSKNFIVIKDHVAETPFDRGVLRLMDWVGNAPHGVPLPYCYLSRARWDEIYKQLRLTPVVVRSQIPLYPAPISFVFGRRLHFISFLRKEE
jgi:SAM-dependent methyltransferase